MTVSTDSLTSSDVIPGLRSRERGDRNAEAKKPAFCLRLSDELLDDDFEKPLRIGLARIHEPVPHRPPRLGVEHVRKLESAVAIDDEMSVLTHEINAVLIEGLFGETGFRKLDEGVELGARAHTLSVRTHGDDSTRPEVESDGLRGSGRGLLANRSRGTFLQRCFFSRLTDSDFRDSYPLLNLII